MTVPDATDKGYGDGFARELSALSQPDDVAWAMSTSGNSPNVLNALRTARERGLRTLGLTGAGAGAMRDYCDVLIAAPSHETPRIQELHVITYHAICALLEERLVTRPPSTVPTPRAS